jgi:hypothetical protein
MEELDPLGPRLSRRNGPSFFTQLQYCGPGLGCVTFTEGETPWRESEQ